MGFKLITDVHINLLKQIHDDRGAVFHVMKSSEKQFNKFGEAYFSKINNNVIKGWKFHKEMKQNFCVPFGKLKLVLFDNRENSKTKGLINEIILDDSKNYKRVTIPKNIWYSFKCLSDPYCLLLNISNIEHDPLESTTIEINTNKIPYSWII